MKNFFTYADLLRVYKQEVEIRNDGGQRFITLSICYAASLLAVNQDFRDRAMLYIAKDLYGPILGTIIYYYKRGTNPYIESAFPSIFHRLDIPEFGRQGGWYSKSFVERRIAILEKLVEKFPNTKIFYEGES